MRRPSRREFTGLTATALTAGLGGCLDTVGGYLGNDESGEFLVVTADLVHSPGYRWEAASYPEDVVARIAVENRRSSRQRALLVATLHYDPPDGEAIEWTLTRELNEGRGVSPTLTFIFEDVYEESRSFEHYEINARIVEEGGGEPPE